MHTARSGSHFNKFDNGFYLTCNVGTTEINFLIDCGGTTSLLSEKMLQKLGSQQVFRLRPMDNLLKTVNGEVMQVAGSVDLVVQMGVERFDLPFVVCGIEADGILGQDFLRSNVDSINYKRPCLVMGDNTVTL